MHVLESPSPSPRTAESRSALARDQRGAVLLLGVFFSVFLVAMLYYVVAIGEAIGAREGLQDSADAGAFAAAILHARGMNLIAFLNIVMAALVAVLVVCRVVQGVCLVGIAIAVALASTTFGGSLAAVPVLKGVMSQAEAAHRTLREPVLRTVGVLHKAQWLVSRAVPPVAVIDSVLEVSRHHPPARYGVALPGSVQLPVEPDRFEVLCERAGETIVDLVARPFDSMGLGIVIEPVKGVVGTVTGSASAFFCGAGRAVPPTYERREEVSYPRTDAVRRCETAALEEQTSEACAEAQRELEAARPQDTTGHCRPTHDCSLHGEYARWAREARRQCQPRDGFSPVAFTWQEQKVRAEYTYTHGSGWIQTEVLGRAYRLHREAPRPAPCGPRGALAAEWQLEPYPTGRLDELSPLCAERPELPPAEDALDGDRVTVEYREASHLFGCQVHEQRRYEPFAGAEPLGGGAGREPHRVVEETELGGDRFQLRAVTWGDEPRSAHAERIVALAAWGRDAEAGRSGHGPSLDTVFRGLSGQGSRLSLAQAEFYYDHAGGEARSEWLWNMKWTARLVRFRMPDGLEAEPHDAPADPDLLRLSDVSSFGAVCREASISGCNDLDDSVAAWERFLLH